MGISKRVSVRGEVINTNLCGVRSWQRNDRWGKDRRFWLSRNGLTNFRSRGRGSRDGGGEARRSGDDRGLHGNRSFRRDDSGGRHGTTLETDQLQSWLLAGEKLASGQGRLGRWGWRVDVGLEGVGLHASDETVVFLNEVRLTFRGTINAIGSTALAVTL